MISYIFILLGSIFFLYPKEREIEKNSFYVLIFSSIIFAQSILGLISLILIHSNLSKFPILLISILIAISNLFYYKKSIDKFNQIKIFLLDEINNFFDKKKFDYSSKKYIYIILFLLIIIFLSSFGPVNHPDATDYHVGYPFQYYLRGGFFIDGGLHQGLVGIGDYANLAFIQEKNIWFIRPMQIINLPIIILFLSKKIKNNLFLVAFISVPVFISWSTMAKPLFLGDSTLVILYLIWKESKSNYSLKFLLISMIFCIGYKISGLIIVFPIFLDIGVHFFRSNNLNKKILKDIKYIFKSKEFVIATFIIISLFLDRQIITGNFAYPLLTNVFNKNDIQKLEFSKDLQNYRDIFFFIKIFIPSKIPELNGTIGPGIFIISFNLFLAKFKNFNETKKDIFYVYLGQILMLTLFCQGRADYYSSPLILMIYQSSQLNEFLRKNNYRYIINISIKFQILISLLYLFYSINLNFLYLINYKHYMNTSATGFFAAQVIDKNLRGNFVTFERNTKLYYPANYIAGDKIKKCIFENELLEKDSKVYCFEKYDINQIITYPDYSIPNNLFKCKIIDSFQAGRNIFNRKKIKLKYCIRTGDKNT